MNLRRIHLVRTTLGGALVAVITTLACGQGGMLTTIGNAAEVLVPDSPALVPATAYTIEAWFYFNPSAPGGTSSPTIMRKNTFTPSYLLRTTSASGGNLEYYANTGGTYYPLSSSVPTPINSWHHVAATHDGQMARIFLDGVQVGSLAVVGPPGFISGALLLAKGDPFSESWRGSLDEIRIWSIAKTAAQIQADMMFERDNVPNLVAAWHFNGNYLDLTGNHHGQPNGQVTIQPSTSPVLSEELSAPALSPIGSPLVLTLKSAFPATAYLADVSITGNTPGMYIPPPIDKVFPLNPPLLNVTFGSYFEPLFEGFLGFIGPNNQATVTFNVPAFPGLIGVTVHGSYVLLDPAYPFGIRHVGNGTATVLTGPTPIVGSVVPGTSPTFGGVPITILGSNFQPGATVTIGTVSATAVIVLDSQTIQCTTPALPVGPKVVTVTNPDTMSGSLPNGITYVPDVVITGISPPTALPGASVTVLGSGFVSGMTVTVGGISVSPASVTPSSLSWIVPANVPCDASVVVTAPDGQTENITWNRSPVITQAIGATGAASGGSSFFLVGANYYPGSTVTVGGANATILNFSPTALFVQAPPGSPGPATIALSSITGCVATNTYIYQ